MSAARETGHAAAAGAAAPAKLLPVVHLAANSSCIGMIEQFVRDGLRDRRDLGGQIADLEEVRDNLEGQIEALRETVDRKRREHLRLYMEMARVADVPTKHQRNWGVLMAGLLDTARRMKYEVVGDGLDSEDEEDEEDEVDEEQLDREQRRALRSARREREAARASAREARAAERTAARLAAERQELEELGPESEVEPSEDEAGESAGEEEASR